MMTEESELELETEVSKPEPQREDDYTKQLVVIAAVVCTVLLIITVAGAFWTMSGDDESVDDKGSGEAASPPSYQNDGSSKGQTPYPANTPNEAPKTPLPPSPYTTGNEMLKRKSTTHKHHTASQGLSSTSITPVHNRTLSTTPAVFHSRTMPTIPTTLTTTVRTTTRTSPSTTTTTVPPLPTLVCTVMQYPSGLADNVCDYLFYDSLYRDHGSPFIGMTDTVTSFLEAAAKSNLTRFGFSVEVSALNMFSNEFGSKEGQKYWKKYLDKRVYDWGFLNVNEIQIEENPDVLKQVLTMMKKMDDYQKQQTTTQAYMMLGIYFMPTLCDQVAQNFKTIFLPAHVILLGQVSYGDIRQCVVLPATNYIDPRQEKKDLRHGHTLRNAIDSTMCLESKGLNTSYSVSVEMEAMQFQHGPGNLGTPPDKQLYTACSSTGSYKRLSLAILCATGPTTWHYQDHYKTSYALDKNVKFLNTFDTKESLQFKICDAWSDYGSWKIGISAYSLEAEFRHPIFQCPKENWTPNGSRLLLVQKFRKFLSIESSTYVVKGTFFPRCRQLT